MCPYCHYPIGDLPEKGWCPECGTIYSRAGVVKLWRKTFGIREDW